jgi:hypothetical protein
MHLFYKWLRTRRTRDYFPPHERHNNRHRTRHQDRPICNRPQTAGAGPSARITRKAVGAIHSDLADAWQKHGIEALERCAQEEPAQFVRTIAGMLPKDIRIDATLDAVTFAARFEAACEMLGNARQPKLIEHDDGS